MAEFEANAAPSESCPEPRLRSKRKLKNAKHTSWELPEKSSKNRTNRNSGTEAYGLMCLRNTRLIGSGTCQTHVEAYGTHRLMEPMARVEAMPAQRRSREQADLSTSDEPARKTTKTRKNPKRSTAVRHLRGMTGKPQIDIARKILAQTVREEDGITFGDLLDAS
ncbi:hypothetical protein EJ06DRAFT_521284 [Trichodelitschia bisporula]|uniref:Uncharacterized protein n=1 Tax=Trichodelitschia bisporula TaxID=703511 RepID=A0A6G1I020_9PEZI|nr:hypothetical protein EJ06DRAFT_521284 [Trichodelitschia bisporula]